jgi:hypothetical protein
MLCAFARGSPASAFIAYAYTASSEKLLLGRSAGGAPPYSPPRPTAVATEATGTPAARFLPLPFSSLYQLVQPLNMGYI